ncbi:secretin N-terminal domain-containing protein [Pseudomonas sp. 5P_3.1_Bac2]|uniref:secretin N-terminal domain-containing protein n=1 Tax=Pseudomonas sp. 5P_3.1_Bac2 TaxID=2971617 RepID=UPI0021C5BD39|nr:secretin N-terminal domain-containing protein [Pseudomonas sp. 5P_3.1_Bac2]MCU1717689.1 type II and III secretion system protein [Pseudomonas sp. 5P_3.1_Bac2]
MSVRVPTGLRAASLLLSLLVASVQATERVELYDATLQDFVEWAAVQLNKSVVVGSDIRSAPVSIFASYNGPNELEQLLENAVQSSGFHFSSTPSGIRISAQAIPVSPELITQVFQLQHLQSDFAEQSVRDVLNSRTQGQDATPSQLMVTPSPTSNAVIVTGTRQQLDAIAKVLAEIDQPRRQVEITAVIAELSDDDFSALGLNVGAQTDHLDIAGASLRSSDRSDLGFSLTFTGPTISAFLQAIKTSGNSRLLSTPQLLTLNRESASIVVGQNVPFITGQTTSGSTPASDPFQTIVRQDVGVSLEVTPFITPANAIELQVSQSASSVSDDKTAADIITNTRRVLTRVQLKDGQGVLLGGLRSQQIDKSVSAVPFLSDIPYLGRIFRSESERIRTTNLVVLLTARIHRLSDSVVVPDSTKPWVDLSLWRPGEALRAAGGLAGHAQSAP